MRSLQGKIVLVYLALAALAIGLSLMALLELNLIAAKVRAGSKVAEFFDTTLELRRFEKNHFLYGQPEDLRENARYTARALELLQRDRATFATLMDARTAAALADDLRRYGQRMSAPATGPDDEVRRLGHRIVSAGETLAARERQKLHEALAAHQRNLLFSVAAVVALLVLAGVSLARWVTRPLKAMEASMEAVAQGRLTRLGLDVRERELASLTLAFNHVLDELERRQHTLVRSEKLASLGTLLSGVAHELNNPLSNISSSAQILKEELLPSPAGGGANEELTFHQQLVNDIDQETRRAAQIVRSLLDYARDRGFQRRPVNLSELVDETLRFLKTLRAPGIELKLDLPAELAVEADRPRLQQALLNLIKNAFEAMAGHGVLTISARPGLVGQAQAPALPVLAGRCRAGQAVVDLSIADSGPGIPADVLPRIFDPFFTTKPIGHGNGLGLFIVHEIIDEHGGCIGVECPPEGGTRFHIRLPVTAPTDSPPQRTET